MEAKAILIKQLENCSINGRLFPAEGNVKACVLIANAMGVTQKYYTHLASFFTENAYHCLSFDYRGTGLSAPKKLRTFQANLFDWVEDISLALDWIHQKYPSYKIYFVSHSIGSQLMGFLSNNYLIDQSIFLASSIGYWKEQGKDKWKNLFFLSSLIPFSNLVWGYTNAKFFGLGENYPKNAAAQWRSWCLHPKYLGLEFEQTKDQAYFLQYKNKISSFWFSDDTVANHSSVSKLLAFYKNADTKMIEISPASVHQKKIGHIGFLSRKFKESIWQQILEELA